MARDTAQATDSAASCGCAVVDNPRRHPLDPSYYIGVGLLQGDSLAQARSNLAAEWRSSYLVGACFWFPVMSFNFAVVPPQYRVRTMAFANMAWSVIIDYMAHRGQPRAAKRREAALANAAV